MYKVSIRDLVKYVNPKGFESVKTEGVRYTGYTIIDFNIQHSLFDNMVQNSNKYLHYITIDAEYRKQKYKNIIELYNHKDGIWEIEDMTPEDMKLIGENEYLLVLGK